MSDEPLDNKPTPLAPWLPALYQQHNMLPWRAAWIQRQSDWLRVSIVATLLVGVLFFVGLYFLYWQREVQTNAMSRALKQQALSVRESLQTVQIIENQWLYKQSAITSFEHSNRSAKLPMLVLLQLQTMMDKVAGKAVLVELQGVTYTAQLQSPLPWDKLASGWWLPPSGRLEKVEQVSPSDSVKMWLLHVEVVL